MNHTSRLVVLLCAIFFLLAGISFLGSGNHAPSQAASAQDATSKPTNSSAPAMIAPHKPAIESASDGSINLRRTTVVDVVERSKNAVVYISSRKIITQRVNPFGNDPFLRQFDFGMNRTQSVGSLGSGFILHPDGYIVTNNHVIDRARQIEVTLLDGRKFNAEIVSADSEADIAILKIDSDGTLPTLPLGDSSDLMMGEPVIAVGNPYGFSHSVSTGIVSQIHRDLKSDDEKVSLTDLVQTDAAINPGNSGGPLLNIYGQVIGINTAIINAQNIGFAIQVNRLRELIPSLMDPTRIAKLEMPIKLKEIVTIAAPATVKSSVTDETDRAITSIDGKTVSNIADAQIVLLNQKADREFVVQYADMSSARFTPKQAPLPDAVVKAKSQLGLDIQQMSPMVAERFGLAVEDGLLITGVDRDSIAAKSGLQPNDIIRQLGRYRVQTLADFGVLLEHLPKSGRVVVGVVRGQEAGYVTMDF